MWQRVADGTKSGKIIMKGQGQDLGQEGTRVFFLDLDLDLDLNSFFYIN